MSGSANRATKALYAGVGLFLIGAPFIGAAIAFGLGERQTSALLIGGVLLMIAGVALHLLEEHEHDHEHDNIDHEHAHTHDDGHHTHTHEVMPQGVHSHRHRHESLVHRHPHTPDLHHGHRH
ncbi:hypothetical protein ACO0K3_03000 [Undibacterium sp. Rencai35W]|uniref:hypothetical protein n=1 Tax=Undibacterium sp. Rencai35W TaxID=3413046 RepID=UPI003BF040E5